MTLLSQLEAATEGSAALDRLIAREFGWHRVEPRFTRSKHGAWIAPEDFCGVYSDGSPKLDGLHGTTMHFGPPRYTTNLQDAVSLVPEGWTWQVSNRAPKPHKGRAYIHNGELQFVGGGQARNAAYQGFEDTAVTPALALCIAIIKAHESKAEAA